MTNQIESPQHDAIVKAITQKAISHIELNQFQQAAEVAQNLAELETRNFDRVILGENGSYFVVPWVRL